MNFETSSPRTSKTINPANVPDPTYNKAYKVMARKCAFPAAFSNGLFQTFIGVFVCLTGFFNMAIGYTGTSAEATIVLAAAISLIAAIAYSIYMQTNAVFPRGGSMFMPEKKAPIVIALAGLACCIGLPIYGCMQGNYLFPQMVTAGVFGALFVISYYFANKNWLMGAAFVCLLIPLAMGYMVNYTGEATVLQLVMLIVPIEGIVFLVSGMMLMQKSTATRSMHNRDMLHKYLTSGVAKMQFAAASFVCSSIDPNLLPELFVLSQSSDYTVAYTAQVAIGNTWGPRQRLKDNFEQQLARIPEEAREKWIARHDQQVQQRHEMWVKHHDIAMQTVQQIAEDEGEALESMMALVSGENELWKQGRRVAIELLGAMRTPRAYSTLMTLLMHKRTDIAHAAAVGFYGADSKAVLYIEKFFVGKKSWIRCRAIDAARYMLYYLLTFDEADAEVAYSLLSDDVDGLLDTDDTVTFAHAITLLGARGKDGVAELQEYCRNDRPLIKAQAMCALCDYAPESAAQIVIDASNEWSAPLRYAALKCVDKLELDEAHVIYTRLTQDRNRDVAQLASELLQQLNAQMSPMGMWGF